MTVLKIHHQWVLKNLLLAPKIAPDYIGHDVKSLGLPALKVARSLGIPVVAWTVKSLEQARETQSFWDNLIFENFDPRSI